MFKKLKRNTITITPTILLRKYIDLFRIFSLALALTMLLIGTSGCTLTQMNFDNSKTEVESYSEHVDGWLLGFYFHDNLSVHKACSPDASPTQIRFLRDTEDLLFTIFTLGIYSPYSIEISCRRNI